MASLYPRQNGIKSADWRLSNPTTGDNWVRLESQPFEGAKQHVFPGILVVLAIWCDENRTRNGMVQTRVTLPLAKIL
jgi:hypothetical protein